MKHQLWHLNDENNYELQKRPAARRKRRFLPIPPHYVLLLFSISVAFKSIIATLDYQSSEHREWQRLQYETAPIILEEIKRQSPGKEFSILLKGSRLDFMQQALDNYSRCSSVREIQMDMDGFEIPLDSLLLQTNCSSNSLVETTRPKMAVFEVARQTPWGGLIPLPVTLSRS